jgi:23S rRNA (cytosine1962-C5)-methyltransferase
MRAALAPPHAVRGATADEALWVAEQGLEYEVHLGDGLGTGLFVDQRANRQLVRSLAAGKRMANLFAYTGSFTAAAIAGGAAETVTVDISRPVLDWAARNLERVLGASAVPAHRLVRADAFDWLAAGARRQQRFDLVVLDPPSFATTRSSRFSAASDYGRLAAAALRCVAARGQLLACTNHRGTTRAGFAERIAEAVAQAGRHASRLELQPDPVDCPAAPGRPCHLKSVLVELAD